MSLMRRPGPNAASNDPTQAGKSWWAASSQRSNVRHIEAEGNYDGVHCLEVPTPTEREIEAEFERGKHEAEFTAVEKTKQLEAKAAILSSRKDEVEQHWRHFEAETRGMRPPVVLPLVAIGASVLAAYGESLLIAPVMDGFGIASRTAQFAAAWTVVVIAAGLFHFAAKRIHGAMLREEAGASAQSPVIGRLITAAAICLAIAFAGYFGWWRAGVMIFTGEARQGAWGAFLHGHAGLTRICVTLLTIGLPLFAAVALDWGFTSPPLCEGVAPRQT